jgi:hypothetical protein
VILAAWLRTALQRLNPAIPSTAIDLVLQQTELLSEQWSREDLGTKIQSPVADALATFVPRGS